MLRQALSVAAGQPGENVQLNRVDEIGMILRAVNQSGLNLRSLVDDVSEQVAGVQATSSEIAQGNGDLSARTEQTASNLQETAASMEQMNSTVRTMLIRREGRPNWPATRAKRPLPVAQPLARWSARWMTSPLRASVLPTSSA